jgi:hypothetical protein
MYQGRGRKFQFAYVPTVFYVTRSLYYLISMSVVESVDIQTSNKTRSGLSSLQIIN